MSDDNVTNLPGRGNFAALGHAGSGHFLGLETFANPGVGSVIYTSDEVTAVCPITGQPDFYEITITLEGEPPFCIESKSLKLYFGTFRSEGLFSEALAVKIRDDIFEAIDKAGQEAGGVIFHSGQVQVQVIQRPRGGIEIQATA